MEFSSVWYLSFCSFINQVSLTTAVVYSSKVYLKLPQFIQYSHAFMFPAACFSTLYAFLIRPMMEPDLTIGSVDEELYLFFILLQPVIGIPYFSRMLLWYQQLTVVFKVFVPLAMILVVPVGFFYLSLRYRKSKDMGNFLLGFAGPLLVYPSHTLCCALFTTTLFSIAPLVSCKGLCEAKEIVRFAESHCSCFILTLGLVAISVPFFESSSDILDNPNGKKLGIPLGLLGYVLSQYSIQEKSVPLLVILFSFSISWLANLAMIRPSTDLGIFSFFIGAILDSAISLFQLGKFTWIVCAGCGLLMLLQQKLNSVTLRYPPAKRTTLSKWRRLETQIDETALSYFRYYEDKWTGKESKGNRRPSDDELISLPLDLFLCAAKLSKEKMAGKEEESKEKLIDKLLQFTLHLLKQNEEIIEEEEKEISRDEQTHTLCHLYFRLRNLEEKGILEEQIKNNQIALCSYLVLRLLQNKGNEREKANEQRIIRLCRLILDQPWRKMENTRKMRKNKIVKKYEIGLFLPGLVPGSSSLCHLLFLILLVSSFDTYSVIVHC